MEAESSPSAQPPPDGSSPILPAMATVAAVAATNDPSRTEGDAAKDLDRDDKGQREGDIPPQKGEGPGYEGGNGQSAQEHSLEKPSSVTDSNNSDGGCSAGAKSYCGVASGRMYDFSEDNSDTLMSIGAREGQASLLNSDSDGDNDERYTHSRKDGDDIHVEAKQSREGDGEENNEESSRHETEHESLFEDDVLFIDEQAEKNNGSERNYLPPAPEVDETDDGIGGNAVSKTSGNQINTNSFGPVGRLEQDLSLLGCHRSSPGALEDIKKADSGLDHEMRKSMELAGLGYSGKALEESEKATLVLLNDDGLLEKVPPMAPRPPADAPVMKDGVVSGVPLASKEVVPETVATPGPSDGGFALDRTAGRVLLESEGPRPEVVAAPGPNEELSGMVALSSPRGMISLDVRFPMEGQNLDEASANGGFRGDAAQQTPSATPGAVAVQGPMIDEPTSSDHHGEDGSDYATATPFAANVVVDDETHHSRGRQRGRPLDLQRPALDPNEKVYEGISMAKDDQSHCWWPWLSRYKLMWGLGFLVICVAVAIGVPIAREKWHNSTAVRNEILAASSEDSSPFLTQKPSVEPTMTPSVDLMFVKKSILLKAAEHASISTTVEALMNKESPQHMALEWLVDKDEHLWGMDDMIHLVQRFSLATFYFATGGDKSWRDDCYFLSNVSECKWVNNTIGVWCGEDNQIVKGLDLSRNGMKGTIPDELGLLVGLKEVYFGRSNLNGTLPSALVKLSKLEVLDLAWNSLSGTLPFSLHSTNLQNLQKVWLGGNDLTGTLPQGLFMSTNMTSLDLNWNQFSGMLPTEIGKLSSLQALRLSDNDFSGQLPSNIWTLTELQWLDLSFNKFRGQLPSSIRVLTELQWLDLSYNAFSGMLPSSIGALTKLESLFLFRNRCNGPLPSSIGALTNLRYLSLHQNRFTGTLPDSLGNLTALQYLILSRNKFPGTIPDIFENMIDLEYLFLDVNKFTGTIPPSIASAKNLTNLSLANTSVAGDMAHFCNNRSKDNLEWIADCYGDSPEVVCDCCYVCCSDYERSSNLTVSDLLLTFYFGEGNLLGCFNMSDT